MFRNILGKVCKPTPGSKVYKSKCSELVYEKSGPCCVQRDLGFIKSAVRIYTNRTIGEYDKEIEKMKKFLIDSNSDFSGRSVDIDSYENGIVLAGLLQEYAPSHDKIKVRYEITSFSINEQVHRYVFDNYDVVMDLDGIRSFKVPIGKKIKIEGDVSSSVNIGSHPLLTIGSIESSQTRHIVKSLINGKTKINADIDSDINEIDDMLSTNAESNLSLLLARGDLLEESTYVLKSGAIAGGELKRAHAAKNDSWRVEIGFTNNITEGFELYLKVNKVDEIIEFETVQKCNTVLDQTSLDMLMHVETTGRNFIQQDENNFVIIQPNGSLSLVDFTTIDFNNVFYECTETSTNVLTPPDPRIVIADVDLINARSFGSWGYMKASELKAMSTSGHKVFESSLDKKALSFTSRGVFLGEEDMSSASHCQPGQDGEIMSLKKVVFNC